MDIYASFKQLALAMITKYGETVTWRQMTDGTPVDAAQPWKPAAATFVDTSVRMIFFPDSADMRKTLQLRSDTEVAEGDLVGIMPSGGFTPSLKDFIIRSGATLSVANVMTIAPNGSPIIHTLGLRL